MNKEQAEAVCEFNDHLTVACGIATKLEKMCCRSKKKLIGPLCRLHSGIKAALFGDELWFLSISASEPQEPMDVVLADTVNVTERIYADFAGVKGEQARLMCDLSRELLKHVTLAGCAVEQIKNERTQP